MSEMCWRARFVGSAFRTFRRGGCLGKVWVLATGFGRKKWLGIRDAGRHYKEKGKKKLSVVAAA